MKTHVLFLALVLVPFLLNAQTKVTRTLSSFDKIGISGGYDKVYLKEGDAESIVLETKGIDPENILTEVSEGTLRIKTKNGHWNNFSATLTITYRKLTSIATSGSSDIESLSVIRASDFKLATSGSGDVKAEFDVKNLHVAISGSSDMTLKGKAEEQSIAISGSGDVDASKLNGEAADVAISGSGDVRLGVKGKVKTSVSGSGNVTNNK
ncbi:MAG: DUF2807 domain-containing protein [Saprospiraceae bacterium]|nr:DUF2807 domain-containing protein [Saprospiraceae bacterium]